MWSAYEFKHLRVQISLQVTDFIAFGYIPRSGTAGSYVVLLAVFLRNFHTAVPCEICSVTSNSLWPHGLYSPWNSPDQNTGVGSLSLLQGIFLIQGLNTGLLHRRWILYSWTTGKAWKIALFSHTSKVMLKIIQARLQQYVNRELTDVQDGFWKGKGSGDQIANIW